jgi:uncharacterized protein involved in exopolysaccharide biosynthesis
MTDLSAIPNPNYRSRSTWVVKRWKLYLLLWIVANGMSWSAALLYLKVKPVTYKSTWSINLPASGSTINVSVPQIGEVRSSNDSPYRTFADPRENYKFFAASDDVLEAAANQLKMPMSKFGKARIKILDNTTLMTFEITGKTPKQAQEKAFALHNALETKLHQLRIQEMAQQDRSLQIAISADHQKLQAAKQNLYAYKASSSLNSSEQLRDLSVNLEGLRRERAETAAKLQEVSTRVKQLSASLGLSTEQAVEALTLQSDQLYQKYLAEYSKASAELVNLSAKFLSTHPAVIAKQKERDVARAILFQQAQSLLGRPVSQATLEQLNLSSDGGSSGSSSERVPLFQELILLQAQQQGMQEQTHELERQITQLESRLKVLSQQESTLDSLQRDVKIAEAVFSSNLTKLNLSKSELAKSYPQIAIVTKPNLPTEPSGSKRKLVLMGAVACSFFLTTGTVALWLRDYKIQKTKQINWK